MPKKKVDKEELILTAMKVFRSKGYYHTSVADLAQACSIEKPHFYYYFKDKEHMMLEVLGYAHAFVKTHILAKAFDENYTVEQRAQKMMENARKLHIEDFGGCIMGNTILETSGQVDAFSKLLQQYIDDWVAALAYLLEKKLKPEEANAKAHELVNQLQGGMMMMRLYRDPYQFYKATENVIGSLG